MTDMPDILAAIVSRKRDEVETAKAAHPRAEVEEAARKAPKVRDFQGALTAAAQPGRPALLAEIKKASPSQGVIRTAFDPAAHAQAYEAGGAAALSVLTDTAGFQGRGADLVTARAACALPVLRKDFMIDLYQIAESRALGADCILLILACLDDGQARELERMALSWGMDVLIEVHDAQEMRRALTMESRLIGINNRDLRRFVTDLQVTEQLAALVPDDVLLVSESGIAAPADVARVAAAGARAVLVGEHLMRQADLSAAARTLINS